MRAKSVLICVVLSAYFVVPLFSYAIATTPLSGAIPVSDSTDIPTVVRKHERWPLVSSEFGDITAVKISDGNNGCRHLHFITVDHNALLLPVYLYSEMVFYVNSGNGVLSWIDVGRGDYELQRLKLEMGDIYTLQPQTVFYLVNNLESDDSPQDLQIYAIFTESATGLSNQKCGRIYAGVRDLVLRFDNKVLQATLGVSEEVIEELRGGQRQTLFAQQHEPETNTSISEVNSSSWFIRAFLRTQDVFSFENKKKKKKDKKKKKKDKKKKDERNAYNIFKQDRNVENSYRWSVTVNNQQLEALHDSGFSVFMVNLTEGSVMGPHWNTINEEIVIVLGGQGMVHVVCPTIATEPDCKSSRFKVKEGDVFVVPPYHLMAQMSFSNQSFIFMGFTKTTSENNHPSDQYLAAGEDSILQTLDKTVLGESFDASNATLIDEVLLAKKEEEYMFLECKSCAKEEERLMEEEAERESGGAGRRRAEIEGEIARREEEEMRRRWRKGEEGATRRRKGVVNGCN